MLVKIVTLKFKDKAYALLIIKLSNEAQNMPVREKSHSLIEI